MAALPQVFSSITGGGANNTGFQAKEADLQNPSTVGQANTAYDQTQSGLAQQQAFLQALQAQNGTQNQSAVFNQLQGVANGTGPNPAQAQLAQATGANVANQAALMAGQRGTGANAGMIARQAAQQGANTQQQAAGQAAALQANQSLGALNQMGGVAGQQVAQQQTGLQNYNSAAQGQQQNLLNSINGQNTNAVGNVGQANSANVKMAAQNGAASQNLLGNLTGALGPAMSLMGGSGAAAGGAAAGSGLMAGGAADAAAPLLMLAAEGGKVPSGPMSKVGQHFHAMAKGGKVDLLLSPGEKYLSPQDVKKVEKGANPMAVGKTVPGKAAVGGAVNSYANDTYRTQGTPGAIILPRSVTQAKDRNAAGHKFVDAVLSSKGKSLPKKPANKK